MTCEPSWLRYIYNKFDLCTKSPCKYNFFSELRYSSFLLLWYIYPFFLFMTTLFHVVKYSYFFFFLLFFFFFYSFFCFFFFFTFFFIFSDNAFCFLLSFFLPLTPPLLFVHSSAFIISWSITIDIRKQTFMKCETINGRKKTRINNLIFLKTQ